MQRIDYFARQEYALIAVLGDDNENIRQVGVAKMLARRKQVAEESTVLTTMTAHTHRTAVWFACSMY